MLTAFESNQFGFVYLDLTFSVVSLFALFLLALILTMKFAFAFCLSASTGAALVTEPPAEVLLARSLQHHLAEVELDSSMNSKCDNTCGHGNYATCMRVAGRTDGQCCGSDGDGIACGMNIRS